jgi:glycine cleavage system aminomethyltransferase T
VAQRARRHRGRPDGDAAVRFRVHGGDIGASQIRDFAWLKRHIPDDAHCIATDVTSGWRCSPSWARARARCWRRLSGEDLSNAAFPFGRSREIEIGYGRARAARISYVGELGWELYVPAEFAAHVFDTVQAAGAAFGLRPAGMHTMNNARVEKAYRHWGHDIGEEDTPVEAGLSFVVAWDKPGLHRPRRALAPARAQRAAPSAWWRLRSTTATSRPSCTTRSRSGATAEIVGATTSGAWGHRIGKSLALGYVHSPGRRDRRLDRERRLGGRGRLDAPSPAGAVRALLRSEERADAGVTLQIRRPSGCPTPSEHPAEAILQPSQASAVSGCQVSADSASVTEAVTLGPSC